MPTENNALMVIGWILPSDIAEISAADRQGSHTTISIRFDRADDYYKVPIYIKEDES